MFPSASRTARARLRARLACLGLALAGCTLVGDPIPEGISRHPGLARLYAARFPIGAAVEPTHLEGPDAALLAWHFNSVVAENAMKPPRIQPAEGRFDFKDADRIVAWAERRGMRVRGHTLLWHEETPAWYWPEADGRPASGDRVLERLRAHIHAIAGRYRGRIESWDVVNEVIDAAVPGCLRRDRWLEVVGPRYVAAAFRFAHEADPAARLVINDFETTDGAKRACLVQVVRGLLAEGVPVHAVGHQMHVSLEHPTPQAVAETLDAVAALGLDNQVTELDMTLGATRRPGDELALLGRQGERYGEIFRVLARRADVKSVTFWGVTDANTWLNRLRPDSPADRPLAFDAARRPKPAYHAIAEVAVSN